MTDRPRAESSALSDILTMSKKDLLLKLNPEKIEAASDEALAVSLELGLFAAELRNLRALHGPDVLSQLAADEPSAAIAGDSRPRAHRTQAQVDLAKSLGARMLDPDDPGDARNDVDDARPRAHRARQVLAPVLTLMPADAPTIDALTLCNSCDSRQMDPSDPRGYCWECIVETDGAEHTRRQLADANARIDEAREDHEEGCHGTPRN